MDTAAVTADWNLYRSMFDWDGSLRDIVVRRTSRSDWDILESVVEAFSDVVERRGRSATPTDAWDYNRVAGMDALLFRKSGVEFKCDFVSPDVIEIDIDPRDVDSFERFLVVWSLMAILAFSLKKEVVLAHEGERDSFLMKVGFPGP